MQFIIFIIIAFLASPAFGGIIGGLDAQDVPNTNLMENGGFENGESRWTADGSSVFSTVTSGANLGLGSRSGSWDASAGAESLASSQVAINNGQGTRLCTASFMWKGGDANIAAQVWDGSSVLATRTLSAVADWTHDTIGYTCPTSGTVGFRLLSSADAAIVYLDDVYMGIQPISVNINPTVFTATNTVTGFGGTTGTIAHNLNVPIDNQYWYAILDDGSVKTQLSGSDFITDTTVNDIDYDFTGLAGSDTVTVFLQDMGFSAQVISTRTYNSGELSAAPSFPLNHGLPDRPLELAVWTEGQSTAGEWDKRTDLCSATQTQINCDLSSLTIDGTHNVQIIASMTPGGTAIRCAAASEDGLMCQTAQTFSGDKTFSNDVTVSGTFTTDPANIFNVITEHRTATDVNYNAGAWVDLHSLTLTSSGTWLIHYSAPFQKPSNGNINTRVTESDVLLTNSEGFQQNNEGGIYNILQWFTYTASGGSEVMQLEVRNSTGAASNKAWDDAWAPVTMIAIKIAD